MNLIKVCILMIAGVFSTYLMADDPFFQASLTPEFAIHTKSQMIKGISVSVWGENPQSSCAFGFINGTKNDSMGAMFGLVNYSEKYSGAQFSILNTSEQMKGAQCGLINRSKTADPVFQFGFINIIESNKIWFKDFPYSLAPIMILVNWKIKK
jgi:hypothetical protein